MKCIFAFLFIYSVSIIKVNAQNISNEGTEFWLCFPSHVPAGSASAPLLAEMSVFITSKNNTTGVVTCGTFRMPFTVQANAVTEVQVPRGVSYINNGTGVSTNRGIKVTINTGQPKAVVYGHVFAGARSAASLVLPVEALGQKYYAVAYSQNLRITGSQSQFQVICVEPNTVLNITPRINGVVQPTFRQTLVNIGDVYQYQNNDDITGTFIEVETSSSSCKRFAAFSGSSALAIFSPGCNPPGSQTNNALNPSYDPLFQQLYPLESWGTSFPLIPFRDRNSGAIFRVLASQDNTAISVNGITSTINAGTFYETLPINTVSVITANKPVTVTQYALTQYCADSRNRGNNNFPSDPDMVIINPLEYSIKNVTMYSSTKLDITDQFLNVMIPNTGVASFKINGVDRSNLFSPVSNNNVYSYAQINLRQISTSTNFNLTSNVGFNAIAYGFGDFESYAYSAGTNLASSVFINAVRPITNEIINNACRDENFDFRLILPYLSTKLIWTLDAGDAPITQEGANLNPTPVTINGRSLFEYRLPINKVYTTIGIKNIKIISTIPPSAGGCPTGDETLNFEFEVADPPPLTSFSAAQKACINKPVSYNLTNQNTGGTVLNYFWDFGDGTVSKEKNPTHVFTSIGIKIVSLFVKNDVACISNVFSLPIEIFAEPAANFNIQNVSCSKQDILFTDETALAGNTVQSYLWDFGDGSISALKNPTHSYTTPGNYNIKLVVKTESNCEVTTTKNKVIFGSPEIDFKDPEACVNDNVTFQILKKSNDIAFYEWDFGDGTIDEVQKNKETPAHKYISAGNYNVKLKVTSVNGCVTEITKTIIISGANPKSDFAVLNPDNLCSNIPVQFKDLSSIVFGNITKLEWVFNFTSGGLNQILTVNNPIPQDIYEFKYPTSKDDLNYQVTLRAYSGIECFKDFGPIRITVKGSPEISFLPFKNVCLNVDKFKLTEASEISGIPGTGVFTGTGVTADGFFNPSISGTGSFDISYTFTANNGCNDIKKQTIVVNELPTVKLSDVDPVILIGGQIVINATATGVGLTYKWMPSDGLNRDDILNPIASPKETTLYTLFVTSSNGCTVFDAITINVVEFPNFPNTFTPNGDAVNDIWNIKYLETYVNVEVLIFNRYGSEVFKSIGYLKPWDGKTNGKDVPVGTYYYIIDPKNGTKKFSGSVTVIR